MLIIIMEVLIYGTIKTESSHSLQCTNYHRKYNKSNNDCDYGCQTSFTTETVFTLFESIIRTITDKSQDNEKPYRTE